MTPSDPKAPDESAIDEADAPEDTYEPTEVEVTRGRQQGLGMGAKDLAYQRDPTEGDTTQHNEARPDGAAEKTLPKD